MKFSVEIEAGHDDFVPEDREQVRVGVECFSGGHFTYMGTVVRDPLAEVVDALREAAASQSRPALFDQAIEVVEALR